METASGPLGRAQYWGYVEQPSRLQNWPRSLCEPVDLAWYPSTNIYMISTRIVYSTQTPAISKAFHGDAELCVDIWDIGLYWGVCMAWDPKSQKLKFNWEKHCQVRHGHSWHPSIVAPDEGRTTPRLQGEILGPASKELSSQGKTFLDSYRLLPKIEQTNSSAGRKTKSCMPWGLLLLK